MIYMMKSILFILVLITSAPAFSKSSPSIESLLLTFNQYKKLSFEDKKFYLAGLQIFADEWEKLQSKQGIRVGELSPKNPFLFLASAYADSSANYCVCAGWIHKRGPGPSLCSCKPSQPLSQSACVKPSVPCNPLLFGENVCTQRGKSASTICMQSSQPLEKIVAYVNAHPKEYDQFNNQLKSYCAQGRQNSVCTMLVGRLMDIDRGLKRPTSTTTVTADGGTAPVSAPTVSSSQVVPVQNNAPTTPSSEPVGPELQAALARPQINSGVCYPHALVANTMNAGKVMTFEEAYDLACLGRISREKVQSYRDRLERLKSQVYSLSAAKQTFYKRNLDELIANLNACVTKVETSGPFGVTNPPKGQIAFQSGRVSSDIVTVKSFVGTQRTYRFHQDYLAPTLHLKGLEICDLQKTGPAADSIGGGNSPAIF